MIPKSEKQKQRDKAGRVDRVARKEVHDAIKSPHPVTVCSAPGQAEVVSPDAFEKPPPEPPFKLTGKQRRELLERRSPRLAFPKDKPCPITVGEVYAVSTKLSFVVTGIAVTKTDHELHYSLLDERAHNLGKATGYSASSQGSIATRKPREEQPLSGPQFRDEAEGEALEQSELEAIVGESREDRIGRLQAHRIVLERQHQKMETEGIPSDVKWGLRRAIQVLKDKVEREKRMLTDAA